MTARAKPMWSKRLWSALQKRKWSASSSPRESGAAADVAVAGSPQPPHAQHEAPRSSAPSKGGGNSSPSACARNASSTCAQSAYARRSIFGCTPRYRRGRSHLDGVTRKLPIGVENSTHVVPTERTRQECIQAPSPELPDRALGRASFSTTLPPFRTPRALESRRSTPARDPCCRPDC